jgi:hypothetical protein
LTRLAFSRTSFRPHVYRLFETNALVSRVRVWLENWIKMIDLIPTDITELSFWAARQIPTSETFKARILAESSPERRLMVILNINY